MDDLKKRCRRCHGYCPAGTLPSGLCTDCDPDYQVRVFLGETAARLVEEAKKAIMKPPVNDGG